MSNPLGVGFKVKSSFFDQKSVKNSMDRKTRSVLSRFGAFVRTRARSLVNRAGGKKNKISGAGEPPRKHTGLLRKGIFFAYDRQSKNVVIGPVVLASGDADKLEALEHGGSTIIDYPKRRRVNVAPRPFMQPAFDEELPKLSSLWKDS